MEIDDEAHENPQDMDIDHAPEIQRESIEPLAEDDPIEPLDPTDGPRYCCNSEETSLGKEHYSRGRTVRNS